MVAGVFVFLSTKHKNIISTKYSSYNNKKFYRLQLKKGGAFCHAPLFYPSIAANTDMTPKMAENSAIPGLSVDINLATSATAQIA